MKYIRNVLAAVRRADRDFSLIDDGDRILVGLSGGKDSLSLLRALSVYGRFAGKRFEALPVYLDLGFGQQDLGPLKDYCASLGFDLQLSDSRFVYDVLKAHQKPGKNIPCSICSRMKKAAMNRIARERGCNKVAFAHHNDDAIETLFLNMIHGAWIATFEPKMTLERAGITFIRPLIYCREEDLRGLAEEESLPVLPSLCPANGRTDRAMIKELVSSIYGRYPEAKDNFRTMLGNHRSFKLYFGDLEHESERDHSYALKPIVMAREMRGSSFATRAAKEGEEDFLILRHHRKVGEIAFRPLSDHRIEIFALRGPREAKLIAVEELTDRLARAINPVTFVLSEGDAAFRTAAGFAEKTEPGQKRPHWIKKSVK